MKLFLLLDAYRNISELSENGEDFSVALNNITDDIQTKLINLSKVLKELEYTNDIFKKEIERLSGRSKSIESNISFLKEYIKQGMEATNISKLQKDGLTISLVNSPQSCVIENIQDIPSNLKTSVLKIPSNKLPEDMLEYRVDETVDKKQILEMNKESIDVPGTKITRNKYVRIS